MRADPSSPYERLSVWGNQPLKNALQWVAEAGDTTGGVGGHGWSSADSCRGRASRQRASSPAARHPRHLLGGGQGAAQQGQA